MESSIGDIVTQMTIFDNLDNFFVFFYNLTIFNICLHFFDNVDDVDDFDNFLTIFDNVDTFEIYYRS